jgi:hypothetical protein
MKEHNMKRIVVLLATLLLSFGLINAANQVNIQLVSSVDPDTLRIGQQSLLKVSLENDIKLGGMSLGFKIWSVASPDLATWDWAVAPVNPVGASSIVGIEPGSRIGPPTGTAFDMTGLLVTEQDINEVSPDVIMCGGVALAQGLPIGPMQHMYSYYFIPGPLSAAEDFVGQLCFDSIFVPPSGAFVFVNQAGGAFPPVTLWANGGLCKPVAPARDFCPAWNPGLPTSMTINHCGSGNVTLSATDPEQSAIMFRLKALNGGGGTAVVTDNGNGTCKVAYTPVGADVGAAITIDVELRDAAHDWGKCEDYSVGVVVTNNAPTVACGLTPVPVGKGNILVKSDIVGDDDDACDVLIYSVATADAPIGPFSIDPATGVFTFETDAADGGNDYTFTVTVTDGFAEASCDFVVNVLLVEPWEIQIEKTHATLQGHFVDVEITMNLGSELMGGFDFLIGYDASALAFTEAALGDYLVQCGWEYFTYRFNWNGNCGNACPSGLVRLVGMAETNNGANHPDFDCIKLATGHVIATMTFFVSNDRTLECMYLPIRFYWMDCGDNAISVSSGDSLAINRYIYDFEENMIQDYAFGFPGYMGAPSIPCLDGDKVKPVRFIDFRNGGIDVVCSDSIDARGDINVNGVKNEIADAVMFTNYFISGLSAFGSHVEASIAASDVNADGIALSVADLVYLVRVIIGDANPYPKPIPDALAEVNAQNGRVTVDAPVNVGAALFTFNVNGEIGAPVLGVPGMDMKYAREGNELRVLVYNIGSSYIPAGENVVVTVPGNVELTSAEVASYEGFGIDALVRNLPTEFAVKNFPNPFNPQTKIALDMPVASDWSIKIYNVAGQLVKEFSGYAEAGKHEVTWNGTDSNGQTVASGIYFYKAQAGAFSATKKMVLMK